MAALVLSACSLEATPGTFDDSVDGGLDGGQSQLTPRDGATAFDAGFPLESGTNNRPDAAPESCSGAASESRLRFAAAQVTKDMQCVSETQTRTCSNGMWGAWSGTFQAEQCQRAPYASCGAVLHGSSDTRRRYSAALVNDYKKCKFEDQYSLCTDGVLGPWSGTYTALNCNVDFLGTCDLLGSTDFPCTSGTTCTIGLPSICRGNSGHDCTANNDCGGALVCINNKCTDKTVPGGACDEAGDCLGCAGIGATVACQQNTCRCSTGASCAFNNNNWCQGTCVANACAPINTTCDANDPVDCPSPGYSCNLTSSGRRCTLTDGTPCAANTQCAAACRPAASGPSPVCQPLGTDSALCDENVDCASPLTCVNGACASKSSLAGACDETSDCGLFGTIKLACGTAIGTSAPLICLVASGQPCTSGQDCASHECVFNNGPGPGPGPGPGATGTCK